MTGDRRSKGVQARVERMTARARALFVQIAEKHGFALTWDEDAPVEVAAYLQRQPRLDWSLWLNLQNDDEIGIQHDFFWIEWFPADDPAREAAFVEALEGLLTGTVRLYCQFGRRSDLPYAVTLERERDIGWERLASYRRGFHLGPAAGVMILRNGCAPVLQGRAVDIPPPT